MLPINKKLLFVIIVCFKIQLKDHFVKFVKCQILLKIKKELIIKRKTVTTKYQYKINQNQFN